jgi:hypothetical protein
MEGQAKEWQARAREHFEALLSDLGSVWASGEEKARQSGQEAARGQLAEWLNQGLRRLRSAATVPETVALAVELAGSCSDRSGLFLFREDGLAEAGALRSLGEPPLVVDSNHAAAFRCAVETKDPVVAVGTPGEVSRELADRLASETPERVFLFPLAMGTGVKGILLATGNTQPAVLELIAGVTALQMEVLSARAPQKREDLIAIGIATKGTTNETPITPRPRPAWTELTPDDQALHLKAQRFARNAVAQMRLEYPEALREGVMKRDVYNALRQPIDEARDEFRQKFIEASPTIVDYLHLELVRGLAQDQSNLLGPEYPEVMA